MISFRDVCFTLTAVNFIAFWIAAFLAEMPSTGIPAVATTFSVLIDPATK